MDEYRELLYSNTTHSFRKTEGLFALERKDVISEEEFSVGDTVEVFVLPDGRHLLSRVGPDVDAFKIEKITQAHIYFETEVEIKEI